MDMAIEEDFKFTDGGNNQLLVSSSLGHINYCCGFCGYHLNLDSYNRNTSVIGSDYGKSMKRGLISFFSIDETRFTQKQELRCRPYFASKHSWGLFRRRTKLLCRKCGNRIGHSVVPQTSGSDETSSSMSWDGISDRRIFNMMIRALQPSSSYADFAAFAEM